MKCHRLYKSYGQVGLFPWYTGNKHADITDKSSGIICIVNLNDTSADGTEIIPNGFIKSDSCFPSAELLEGLAKRNGIYQFSGKAGDAILFDKSIPHRGSHVSGKHTRYSLWFQITDSLAEREQLLISASQIPLEDKLLQEYRNIVHVTLEYNHPITTSSDLPTNILARGLMCVLIRRLRSIPISLICSVKRFF